MVFIVYSNRFRGVENHVFDWTFLHITVYLKIIETKLDIIEAELKVIEAKLKIMETKLKIIEAKLKIIDMLETLATIATWDRRRARAARE